jgi:hypothetical protein
MVDTPLVSKNLCSHGTFPLIRTLMDRGIMDGSKATVPSPAEIDIPDISKPFSFVNWGHSGVGRGAGAGVVGVGSWGFSFGVDEGALAGTVADGD